jgi:hypothetical protein
MTTARCGFWTWRSGARVPDREGRRLISGLEAVQCRRSPSIDATDMTRLQTDTGPNLAVKFVRRVLGPRNLGRLDYFLRRRPRNRWRGPFNGQIYRQRIFTDLLEHLSPTALVETGTFLGTTAVFLASSGIPVYTVEASPRHHAFAVLRLRADGARVDLRCEDSRDFLRHLASDDRLAGARLLFYLDAHWEEDLPLLEELEIVFANWPEAVVMVDDFRVPETDYGFDDYGPGMRLDMSYLAPLAHLHLRAFFPAVGPSQETGAKKGCVVLCREGHIVETLGGIASLRPYSLAT